MAWSRLDAAPQTVQQQIIAAAVTVQIPNGGDPGFSSVALQIAVQTGAPTVSVTFQGSLDGVNYQPLAMYALSSSPGLVVTTAAAVGIFRTVDATGIPFIQAVFATPTGGTILLSVTTNQIV